MPVPPFRRFTPGPMQLSAAGMNRLLDAVERFDKAFAHPMRAGKLIPQQTSIGTRLAVDVDEIFWIQITGTATGTAYPWSEVRDDGDGTFTVLGQGRAGTATSLPAYAVGGSTSVPSGTVCPALLAIDKLSVLFLAPAAGLAADTVDGSPSYTGITTLRFDEADGFSLTNPAAGVLRIDILAATASQAGIVSTTTQTFGGDKHFEGRTSHTGPDQYALYDPATPLSNAGSILTTTATAAVRGTIYKENVLTALSETDWHAVILAGQFLTPTGADDADGELLLRMKGELNGLYTTVTISANSAHRGLILWDGAYRIRESGTVYGGSSVVNAAGVLPTAIRGGIVTSYIAAPVPIQSLGGLTTPYQTFDSDVNVGIISSGSTHTVTWQGQLGLSRGGTGANLTDPGADRIFFWDESANSTAFLAVGSGLTVTGTTLQATGGGAPSNASYVVLSLSDDLSADRSLTAIGPLVLTDHGANNAVDLSIDQTPGNSSTSLTAVPRWIEITKTFADFSVAATTNDIQIFSLPAGGVVHAAATIHTVAFSGGGIISYNITVGRTGSTSLWTASRNCAGPVTDAATISVPVTQAPLMPDYDTAVSIRAYADAGASNLNVATAGTVKFMLLLALPKS